MDTNMTTADAASLYGMMPLPEPGEETMLCLQMTVGFRASIGMFLFDGWNGGRKGGVYNFGYYFATLVFVATLALIVELVPVIRGRYLSNKPKQSQQYNQILNVSKDSNDKHFAPKTSPVSADEIDMKVHLVDTFLQLIAKACMYLLMLCVMSYNFGVILTASVALPLVNFIVSVI